MRFVVSPALLLATVALAGCNAEDPSGATPVDLLVRVELSLETVESVRVDAVVESNEDGRPQSIGQLRAHWVDEDNGAVLAHGRVPVQHTVVLEEFDALGVRGEPISMSTATVQLRVPRPASGRGRLTLTFTDGVPRAFRLVVATEGRVPIAATEVDVVDDITMPLTAAPAPGTGVGAARSALTSVPADHCGNGVLEEELYYIGGYVGWVGERCDDGNTEDGDGCSADCRYELTHIAGEAADADAFTIVFVPAGWGDLDAFLEYARFAAEGTLAADWFADNTEKLSFWALDAEAIDELGSGVCNGEAMERADEVRDAVMGGRYDGEIRAANPFELVITPPSECRSHAWFGGPVMLGVDGRPEVLAHELGHSVGHLGDEYPYTAEGGSCNPTQANVSDEPVTWACLAENAGGPRCPDGRPVHHHAVSADCTVGTPCARCMMSVAQGDFCPVCYNQLDAAFAARLSGRLSETCNGADDNLDGTVDEGCSCTSCASSCTDRECGQDGCFGDCGTCGAGQVCESNACVDGCDVFCTDALGREICVDDSGPFWCSPGGGGSGLASCACRQNTDGSLSIDSCGACVPMGCASCGASQSCADDSCVDSCPAGTTSCDGICVDTATDNLSCGGCGVVCGAGEGCRGGTCIVSDCAAGESLCGGACVDVLTDDANCGRCGYGCLPWQSCGDGRCTACPDDPDIDICGGYCAIVDSDRGHCGMCDNACGDRAVCDGGVCTCAGADETLCDGACVDVRWNHSHCGACGNACADGEVCSAGACRTCGTGLSFCRLEWEPNYTFCADLLTNADNCGACNSPCADGTCRDGRCESP